MNGQIGVGVIGLGFMGRTHIEAYARSGLARLAGVFDLSRERLSGARDAGGNIGGAGGERVFDPGEVFATDDLDALLAREDIVAVSVCTPTDTHVPIAIRALRAGKHVLVEKPVALDAADIEELRDEAERAGLVCMPAMCMRYWPAWRWVIERAKDGTLGRVRSAAFERLGSMPAWGAGFYNDPLRSGGALVDLHIHDTDFVCAAFGVPEAVTSAGDAAHVTTLYHLSAGPGHVTARGGWLRGEGFAFRMRFVVEFEAGAAEFDLAKSPQLLFSPSQNAHAHAVEVGSQTGYDREIACFLAEVAGKGRGDVVTLAEAAATARVLDAERESLRTGRRAEVVR